MAYVNFTKPKPNQVFSTVDDVSAEEVLEHLENLLIVDVRTKEEFDGELGHVPNSKLIVLDQLEEQISALPRNKTIIFNCRTGARSAVAAKFAIENGYQNVYNLAGGMIHWNKLNFPNVLDLSKPDSDDSK